MISSCNSEDDAENVMHSPSSEFSVRPESDFDGILSPAEAETASDENAVPALEEVFVFDEENPNYREAMRQWVMSISDIAKSANPNFIIIPQNCSPLFTISGKAKGEAATKFIEKIDGAGQESISYGYDDFNKATRAQDREYIASMLNLGIKNGLYVLSVNYCNTSAKKEESYIFDNENGYVSFVSPSLELNAIYDNVINENQNDILSLADAKNWLCLLNPEKYGEKQEYINALCKTNYDVLVIDAFFYDNEMLTKDDLDKLKTKANGGKRLVISYLSIGEAEDYRYYWDSSYYENPPEWMLTENPNWEGNYPVKYWEDEWQNTIALADDSYLLRIIEAGFDGAYLDIVDGYETFENME